MATTEFATAVEVSDVGYPSVAPPKCRLVHAKVSSDLRQGADPANSSQLLDGGHPSRP